MLREEDWILNLFGPGRQHKVQLTLVCRFAGHIRTGSGSDRVEAEIEMDVHANTNSEPGAGEAVWKLGCLAFLIAPTGLRLGAQGCRVGRLPWGKGND